MKQPLLKIFLVLIIILLAWGAFTLFKNYQKGNLPFKGSSSEYLSPPPPPF
jgi:hypothetical protein